MKIGELAKNCGVSKATIRFYMGNGLLIPNENGGNYSFSEQDQDDLQTILRMKEQQFSLKEIQNYISLKRLSNLIEPDTIDECLRIMENKKLEIKAGPKHGMADHKEITEDKKPIDFERLKNLF